MKKITSSKIRPNLKYERKYELKNKVKRNASKAIKTPIRQKAKAKLEKKIGRKLTKTESVGHKKPIAKWGSNSISNLKVQSRKANFAEWGKMRAKAKNKTKSKAK